MCSPARASQQNYAYRPIGSFSTRPFPLVYQCPLPLCHRPSLMGKHSSTMLPLAIGSSHHPTSSSCPLAACHLLPAPTGLASRPCPICCPRWVASNLPMSPPSFGTLPLSSPTAPRVAAICLTVSMASWPVLVVRCIWCPAGCCNQTCGCCSWVVSCLSHCQNPMVCVSDVAHRRLPCSWPYFVSCV